METIKNKILNNSFWELKIADLIKIVLIATAVIWGYARLQAQVDNLARIRETDKEYFKELVTEIKIELREIRQDLKSFYKQTNK